MSAFHVFYIPAIFGLGAFIGAYLGRRALMQELAEREAEQRALEARRAARENPSA